VLFRSGGDQSLQSHSHAVQRTNQAATALGTDTTALYKPQQNTGGSYFDTQNTGAGGSQNMPPTIMLNYIIKV
jgi:hypothetical protein